MAVVKNNLDSLEGCIKYLRRHGFFQKIGEAKMLTKMMGCQYKSDEHKASCFIMFVQKFAETPSDAEILLASVGLLKGYSTIKGATERLLEYGKHYTHRHPETNWKAVDDSLRDIGNRAIKDILEKVAKVSGIPALLADARPTLELPSPRYYKRKPDAEESSVALWMTQAGGEAIAEKITDYVKSGNLELAESLGEHRKILEELRDSGNKQSTTQTAGDYPLFVAVPCLFSPITISAKHHVLYQCGYDDRSAIIIKGSYGLGQFAVISNDYVLRMEPLNKISDIPQSLKDAVVKIITDLGKGFNNKKIGFTYGHKETTRVETLNADLKGMLLAQDLRIEKCSHEMFFTCDVLIVSSPLEPLTEDEQASLLGYITNGGSVLFCGIGYYWAAIKDENGAKRKIEDFPINKLGKFLGFQIGASYIGKHMNYGNTPNIKQLYFTPLQLSGENSIVSADEKIMSIIKDALTNDPIEQGKLGLLFEIGRGLPKNSDYALYWYKMPAFAGNATSQYYLGLCYSNSFANGIYKNPYLYQVWLTLSVQNGELRAISTFGVDMYYGYNGIINDKVKGQALIERAANQGRHNAQFHLGVIYLEQDRYKEAGEWLLKSCDSNDTTVRAEAHYRLALLYKEGKGIPKSASAAMTHLIISAKEGNSKAASALIRPDDDLIDDMVDAPDFSAETFEGTKYADLDNETKSRLLEWANAECGRYVRMRIKEHLSDEQYEIYEKIYVYMDFDAIVREGEKLNIEKAYIYSQLKAQYPENSRLTLQTLAVKEHWIHINVPDLDYYQFDARRDIWEKLVKGEIDVAQVLGES